VANAIVVALEQAAQRLGKTLGEDAGKAVERMYHEASTGVENVVKNIETADKEQAEKLLALAEKAGQHEGKKRLSVSATTKQAAVQNHIRRLVDSDNAAEHDFEITIDKKRYPESAQHIEEAQAGTIWSGDDDDLGRPKPSILTIDRAREKANRQASLRPVDTRPGKDRDEYPPAMFREGGPGASVKYVRPGDNKGAGSGMGNRLRGLPEGTRVKITVK
jgi:hypothetical protein